METLKLEVGQNVVYVDEVRRHHRALLTAIWGDAPKSEDGSWPCVNLLSKTNTVGRLSAIPRYLMHMTARLPGFVGSSRTKKMRRVVSCRSVKPD